MFVIAVIYDCLDPATLFSTYISQSTFLLACGITAMLLDVSLGHFCSLAYCFTENVDPCTRYGKWNLSLVQTDYPFRTMKT